MLEVFNRHGSKKDFVGNLIELIENDELQKGATWLLKAYTDQGSKFSKSESNKILSRLSSLHSWEAKLHVLQCLPSISISAKHKQSLEYFIRFALIDKNKFVRAWSYNGFYLLSQKYSEYEEEAKKFLEMAMRDEAASVKARIRNILKTS